MGDTEQVDREVEHLRVVITRLGSAQADGKSENLIGTMARSGRARSMLNDGMRFVPTPAGPVHVWFGSAPRSSKNPHFGLH